MIVRLPITRIVIAHRPALVERADQVWHLEAGKLVRVGVPGRMARTRVPSF
jgi:ABC-type multidrug transport system fused ATPase/permease subunit